VTAGSLWETAITEGSTVKYGGGGGGGWGGGGGDGGSRRVCGVGVVLIGAACEVVYRWSEGVRGTAAYYSGAVLGVVDTRGWSSAATPA